MPLGQELSLLCCWRLLHPETDDLNGEVHLIKMGNPHGLMLIP